MSKKKQTVWLSLYRKKSPIHPIGATFPGVLDYMEFHRLDMKRLEKKATEEELIIYRDMLHKSLQVGEELRHFIYISHEIMPSHIYRNERGSHNLPKPSDKVFRIENGYLVVNQLCADILKQFRLGKTHMSPVTIYDAYTGEQLLEEAYYFVNVAEQRHAFVPELSKYQKKFPWREDTLYQLDFLALSKDYAVSEAALNMDVDLWHDPMLSDSLFLSDALVSAFKAAGFTKKDWAWVDCTIVPVQ